ncbi:MAG: DUF420 domain-containing protein [Candidatus Hydrothermarchaeales archaeon]
MPMGFYGTAASAFSDLSLTLEVIVIAVFIIGVTYARRHISNRHYKLMTLGFIFNVLFVSIYMIGSRVIKVSSRPSAVAVPRSIYLPTVIVHGLTSTIGFILAGYAVYFGYKHTSMKKKRVFKSKGEYRTHKKIGYTTLIVWIVAFLTGVAVYLMLYV